MIKKILFILFSLFLFTVSVDSFAGAAEKWEYDVKPDTSQKLDVKGHKVDGYGNAANDYEYNRKIDPKTAANRTKMGKVGFGRLLKISGWGLLGTAALEGLLEAVDWVIDPEAQSIWRHKKTDNPDGVNCSYTQNYGGKVYSVVYKDSYGDTHSCPIQAAKHRIQYHDTTQINSVKEGSGRFLRWDTTDFTNGVQYFYADYIIKDGLPNAGQRTPEMRQSVNAVRDKEIQPDKEYLTPEELADYANHTHPDYAKPELAPKLEPHYTPSIQTDLWKPSNPWEYDNSPTVEEVKKELEQAKPEPKDDKIKENEPDPETGGKSFSLPAFCSWATSVCEFIDSFKDEPQLEDKTLDIEENTSLSYERQNYVQFGNTCPFSAKQYALPMGFVGSIEFEADASILCEYGLTARPFIIGLGHLGCLIYLLYALRSGSA